MPTHPISQTEAARAYGDEYAAIGYHLVVTLWTDSHGEMTDMLTGFAATEAEALEQSERDERDGQFQPGETTVYVVTADA